MITEFLRFFLHLIILLIEIKGWHENYFSAQVSLDNSSQEKDVFKFLFIYVLTIFIHSSFMNFCENKT